MLPTVEESRGYDFQDIENADKWKGLFVISLKKVSEQVHPTLTVEESALQYVESLCLRLLAMLCAVPSPLTVQDVEERVARLFPTPLDKWAIKDAHETAAMKKKKTLLPLDRIHQMLQKEVLQYKIDMSVSVFMTAIIEYISADIFKLAGNFVKKISQKSGYSIVTCGDIKTAMCADKVLMDMFHQDSELAACAAGAERRGRRGSLTYAELVRDLLTDVRSFLRDLHLLIRVFKAELDKILESDHQAISLIFGNIMDIYEVTVTLLGNLEDAIEMSQDAPAPLIGGCFEELAEVEEFRCYVRYANTVTSKESREALQKIADDPETAERLDTAGHGFRLCVKYYLPRLLLACVAHVLLYHADVLSLLQIAEQSDDRESFKQVECNLHPIKKLLLKALENGPKIDGTLRMATRARRQLAVDKCAELSRTVDNWDVRDIGQCCNEFIREDTLSKLGPGKRIAERRAYLFDGLLLLCKPVTSLVTVNSGSQLLTGGSNSGGIQLKLKEKLFIRKLEIVDRPDTDEGRHCLELCPRVGPPVVLSCSSCAEKRNWMCDLVMLNTKPMLDRALDSILLDLERRHPLKLPPPALYRFAVPDSPDNLVLEERRAVQAPVIKGATLLKLVERLTYHIYADLNLVRTFLTTYRSFCSPEELLALLIERFKIPEPSRVYDTPVSRSKVPKKENVSNAHSATAAEATETAASDAEKLSKNSTREDWKRYRKEFEQPVKFRVINVLRHWVDQHFYDFEREPALLETLKEFLLSVDGKPMKKWVQSVLKTVQRKSQAADDGEWGVLHVFDKPAPPVLRHVSDPDRCSWHPLALHPVELARQLTTIEFQLYRQVKPSELVGAVWTKKDKERASPNLLRIIKHTTNFTRWMEKWIVESENLEERVGVVCRFLEVCAALTELNNFNAVLAVVAAFGGASVHRLKTTLQMVPPRLYRTLEESRSLNSDHFRRYQERLRSINPPCVPFLGMYLTNILHIEEGNLDYLPNSELINFSKRRKVAEITGEIQQYQNQPYCLTVEPRTRAFLESLDPFPDMNDNEITNYLYEKSLEIEPRQPVKQMPKFPRKYPELSLKPVKVSRRRHDDAAHHSVSSNDDNLSVSQLSPTNSNWDGSSVSSFSIMSHDDRTSDRGSLVSPRLERSASNTFSQLSLFDKGLALFDKTKSQVNSSRASISGGSIRDEPPSPRDRHSPRHERHPSAERRPQALSPRNAIVDAELFYSRSMEHLNSRRQEQERVPPLLPRNSITSGWGAEEKPPPPLPKRATSPTKSPTDTAPPPPPCAAAADPPPPEPPERERPLPSPKPQQLNRMPAISPKRSPAPAPPVSPLVSSADRSLASPASAVTAFSFPAPAPAAAAPAPPTTPHPTPRPSPCYCGTPPPLPPRRRRDAASDVHDMTMLLTPPPLPPRPAPAPELLRPAHSTILQRRHSSNNNTAAAAAPKLPPKPPPTAAAGAPRSAP